MIGPRLLEVGSSEEQRLLRAARSDGPRAELRAKVLFSVGISATGTPSTNVVSSSCASGTTAAGALSVLPAPGSSIGVAVVVHWIGIASVALLGSVGAGFLAGSHWAAQTAPTTENRVPAVWTRQIPEAAEALQTADHIEPIAIARPPARLASTARRPAEAFGPQKGRSESIGEEVRLIDESRAALRTGDASRCLRLLSERRQRFPRGALAPEAALLSVEALLASGQREVAEREAARFLSSSPTGPLAGRVRALLARRATTEAPVAAVPTETL